MINTKGSGGEKGQKPASSIPTIQTAQNLTVGGQSVGLGLSSKAHEEEDNERLLVGDRL